MDGERTKRWRAKHPERARATQKRYADSDKGYKTYRRYETSTARKILKHLLCVTNSYRLRNRLRMQLQRSV